MIKQDAPLAIEQAATEIASLLLPISGVKLLLPTTSVAEVVPYVSPVKDREGPNWYLGDFLWRELEVPVISLELFNGEEFSGPQSRSRLAVLNNTGVSEKLPFIAIVSQDFPRLTRVKEDEISQREAEPKEGNLMAVSASGETAIIPNIGAIERAYADFSNL
ncbi:MAG: chemotaxis protein CheW [Cellvibrionaceae bacterium]